MKLAASLGRATLLGAVCASGLAGQSVRGRVIDAETGAAVSGVEVVLRRGRGAVDRAITDSLGLFLVRGRVEAGYRLEASHIAYATTSTELRLGAAEMLAVDVRLSRSVLALDPITVIARGRDPRHDATYEGLYARRSDLPRVGGRRAVLRTDLEMRALRVSDVLGRFDPRFRRRTYVQIGTGFDDERRGCTVVYWEGRMIRTRLLADILIDDTSAGSLEGIEFYESALFAPAVFRDQPSYAWGYRCSVVVLWPLRAL